MPQKEKEVRKLIESKKTAQLLEIWELTGKMNDSNVSTVRGWLMDELEKRFPKQFDKWLDSECKDEDLRKFIFA